VNHGRHRRHRQFLGVFTSYIDSGFGLLGGEVAFIATTLIVIDVTLAALFWSWGADDDIIARLVKKTLFVGVFAYLIGNWNNLAQIIFDSFAGLGLKGSGTSFSAADLLRPGKVAQTGLDAGRPLLESISDMMGYWSFFENFIQIACLMFAWALVLLAFFILAVQLFVTLIEFKLTTLAGFVLIPFGLFGKTAFMAERVLGNVVSSGIKVLVLAVIIGIGSTLFSPVHGRFRRRDADHRRRHGDRAGRPFPSRPRHLRSRHRFRSGFWRPAAWRRCSRWNRPCCRWRHDACRRRCRRHGREGRRSGAVGWSCGCPWRCCCRRCGERRL
jgi:P-type conjugative transfer protein TrbL